VIAVVAVVVLVYHMVAIIRYAIMLSAKVSALLMYNFMQHQRIQYGCVYVCCIELHSVQTRYDFMFAKIA
jgi:hypothetical protein